MSIIHKFYLYNVILLDEILKNLAILRHNYSTHSSKHRDVIFRGLCGVCMKG